MPIERTRIVVLIAVLVAAIGVSGCGEELAGSVVPLPFDEGETVVFDDGGRTTVATPAAGECVDLGDACVDVGQSCGDDGSAIVVATDDPRVVCLPSADDSRVIDTRDDNIQKMADGSVIVLDGDDDGVDLDGNIDVTADDVTVTGFGPDVSHIEGDVKLDGARGSIVGVLITGNVDVEGPDSTLIDCVIFGNLHVKNSGAVVTNCTVFGDVHAETGSASFQHVLARKNWQIEDDVQCENNRAFEDDNEDWTVQNDEIDPTPLPCPSR